MPSEWNQWPKEKIWSGATRKKPEEYASLSDTWYSGFSIKAKKIERYTQKYSLLMIIIAQCCGMFG